MIRRGQVYWAETYQEKRRPVLVLSPDIRNELANDVIVAPLSSTLRTGPWHVRISAPEGGVPRPSVIQCEQVTTLPKHRLSRDSLGGSLSPARMREVERGVLRAIGIPVDL